MAGAAPRPRREAPAARLLVAAALAAACASMGDPPGGPPDTAPPALLAVRPESGSVVPDLRGAAVFRFDEVIEEMAGGRGAGGRGAGGGAPAGLARLVLLSPVTGEVDVSWHRREIHVEPHEGWKPGRVYRLELVPGIRDLRGNPLSAGRTVIFSTGPAIPNTALSGIALQWETQTALRSAAGFVSAVRVADSLPYGTYPDSTGRFRLTALPPGEYLVRGLEDKNGNRRPDPREAFDTVRVRVDSAADVVLWAFVHDTAGPRLRSAEVADSLTVRLAFAASLDPAFRPDSGTVRVLALPDSTPVLVAAVLTAAAYDSARAAERQRADTAPPMDTVRARPDTAYRAGPPAAQPAARAQPPAAAQDTVVLALLRQRPKPATQLVVRLASPLAPGSRYLVRVQDVPGLAGARADGQLVVTVRRAEPPARPAAPPPERP